MIIGELINTSRKTIKEAVDRRDADYLKSVVRLQAEGGADYIDVNCGTEVDTEIETLLWMIDLIQQECDLPLCLDSPSAKTLEAGLKHAQKSSKGSHMLNSISIEKKVYEEVIPLLKEFDVNVIALCMDDGGIPASYSERIRIVDLLMEHLHRDGICDSRIYLDPLIKPVSANDQFGAEVIHFVNYIRENYKDAHLTCGLSNVSFGLPNRKIINRLYMVQLMTAGMDSFIMNPADRDMVGAYTISNMLLGRDKRCMTYLKAHRKGMFQ